MGNPIETEIKLAASPSMLEHLRGHPKLAGADATGTIITTYFDTADRRLRRRDAALRIRVGSKGRQQTLKLASPGESAVHRVEWNASIDGDFPDLAAFPARPRATLVQMLKGNRLEPIGLTRIARTTRRVRFGGSLIEIAFDEGTIEAGDCREAVGEIELELMEGRFADVIDLVLELPLGPELAWSLASKSNRCQGLAFGSPPAAILARPVGLRRSMDAARGFQAIAWNCLDQLLANYPIVIASGDPEAVHQSRVAVRRLCAAFSLFGDVVDDGDADVLHAEIRAVAAGLAPARDLHVLLGRVEALVRAEEADGAALLAHLAARRDAAMQAAKAMLAAEPFQRLLFRFAAWIEGGRWLAQKAETGGSLPLAPFAARALSRRRRRLQKAGGPDGGGPDGGWGVIDMADAERHRLRICVKKLRYAADFFAPLFRGTARGGFVKGLAKLQDSLGQLNDMAVAAAGRDRLFADLDPITAARLAARFDDVLERQGVARRKLLKSAERALSQVVDAPAWWKTHGGKIRQDE